MGVNKVILIGNLGMDPRMHYPTKDEQLAFFTFATDERGAGGMTRTEWHNIVMTGNNARIAEQYIRKGTRLYLEGKLRTRQYTDKTGIARKSTEIYVDSFEFLGRDEPTRH